MIVIMPITATKKMIKDFILRSESELSFKISVSGTNLSLLCSSGVTFFFSVHKKKNKKTFTT